MLLHSFIKQKLCDVSISSSIQVVDVTKSLVFVFVDDRGSDQVHLYQDGRVPLSKLLSYQGLCYNNIANSVGRLIPHPPS